MALVLPAMQQDSQHMPPPTFSMPFAAPAPMAPPQPYTQQQLAPGTFQIAPPQQPGRGARGRHQQQAQAQRQQKVLGPRTSRGKKRGRRNKGAAGGQPSLAALSAQNRHRAQQHFPGRNDTPTGLTPATAPRTAPHAPHNDNSFILNQHGLQGGGAFDSLGMTPLSTPSGDLQWTPAHSFPAADYSSLGKDAADLGAELDFFGTNEGLVERYSSDDDSSGGDGSEEEGDEPHGWHLRLDEQEAMRGLPDHVRARLASQSSYIAQLEADNLDLQEKYSLLQHELEESRAAVRTMQAEAAAQKTPASTTEEAATAKAAPSPKHDS